MRGRKASIATHATRGIAPARSMPAADVDPRPQLGCGQRAKHDSARRSGADDTEGALEAVLSGRIGEEGVPRRGERGQPATGKKGEGDDRDLRQPGNHAEARLR